MSQLQLEVVSMKSQVVSWKGKTYRYILSLMDIFSKFQWLVPLQRMYPSHVVPQ